MPTSLSKQISSKILGSEWSFGYNCYEVGHTWTPSCTDAALEISLAAALKVMPLYGALYGFSQLGIQQRYDVSSSWETFKSIFRSTFFIFFHAYNGSVMGCAMRRGFGRFYYRVLVCAPALISSYFSLIIEKPARRQALAFYLLNMASEIVFRMAVDKGYFKPIRGGETLLFALSLSAWYNIIKTHGFGHDPVSAIVKVLIGREEAKSRSRKRQETTQFCDLQNSEKQHPISDTNSTKDSSPRRNQLGSRSKASTILLLLQKYSNEFEEWIRKRLLPEWASLKHSSCPHQQDSCTEYVLGPVTSRFLIGYTIQSLLNLTRRPLNLIQQPWPTLKDSFSSPASIRFGLFLMSLVSAGRATSCLLRHYSNSNDHAWHASVSGFVAGLSMAWAPRSSISLYVMWKAVEQYYLQLTNNGKVAYYNFSILTIYAVSAATILYTFALEPKFVRPSYMKFLDRISNHRLHQLNRMVLDVFGTGSSVGYEDYFPDLHPKYMSNQFKELVFNWMIQPYE